MNPKRTLTLCSAALLCATTLATLGQNAASDAALSKILIEGEGWQLVGEGYGFTDAACADGWGNFYFSDLPKATLHRVSRDGKVSVFLENGPKISGLKLGPDGRFYAATQAPKKQIVAIAADTKAITVILDDAQPNDLVVSHKGLVYFTVTGKSQVMIVDTNGNARVGASGINKPNGITLSPDQRTLAVSEYGGTNVWTFRIEVDGSLTAGARSMELRTPAGKADSGGDGSTTDSAGRFYVTSHLGIQVFDAKGAMLGVMARPQEKGCVSVGFAGPNLEYLYACCSDKVYRRKTQATGALFFIAPKDAGLKK